MRIDTVTFHRADNYGAVLQCYALQHTLHKYNCQSKVVDLYSESRYYAPLKGSIRYLHSRIIRNFRKYLMRKTVLRRKERFERFLAENIETTRRYQTYEELVVDPPEADGYITGSDQVWNPHMYPQLVDFYMLRFAKQGQMKASYAASFGSYLPNDQFNWADLQQYSFVSVREDSAVKLLREKDIECSTHIDPVFLLDKKEWNVLSDKGTTIHRYSLPDKYIFVFELLENKRMIEYASWLKEKTGYKIVCLSMLDRPFLGDVLIQDAGPDEFLYLIDRAQYVLSSSFHGSMFGLIMEKEIYAFPSMARDRFDMVFKLLGISNHINPEKNDDIVPLNHIELSKQIKKCSEKGSDYLRKVIDNVDR